MFNYIKGIRRVIKRKNAQIRAEREKLDAAETANRIYAAYIAWLAANRGEVAIPRREISALLGRYRAEVRASGENYIIKITELADDNVFSKMFNSGNGGACENK